MRPAVRGISRAYAAVAGTDSGRTTNTRIEATGIPKSWGTADAGRGRADTARVATYVAGVIPKRRVAHRARPLRLLLLVIRGDTRCAQLLRQSLVVLDVVDELPLLVVLLFGIDFDAGTFMLARDACDAASDLQPGSEIRRNI